mgnify:CR=1 FL=1
MAATAKNALSGLARALAQEGRIILLDEPFTGVDVTTEDQIVALLRSLRDEGHVMLVSTHNLGSVTEFCDRTVLIKGTVLAYGPTAETFTRANLEKAFGGVLRHFVLGGAALHDDADARHAAQRRVDRKGEPFAAPPGKARNRDGTRARWCIGPCRIDACDRDRFCLRPRSAEQSTCNDHQCQPHRPSPLYPTLSAREPRRICPRKQAAMREPCQPPRRRAKARPSC